MATWAFSIQAELFCCSYSKFSLLVRCTCLPSHHKVVFGHYVQTHWAPGNPSSSQSYQRSGEIPPCWRYDSNSCILHVILLLLLFSLLSFQSHIDHFWLPHCSTFPESCCHYICIHCNFTFTSCVTWSVVECQFLHYPAGYLPARPLTFAIQVQYVSRPIGKSYIKCIELLERKDYRWPTTFKGKYLTTDKHCLIGNEDCFTTSEEWNRVLH